MALTERHPGYNRQPKIENQERARNRSTGRNGPLTAAARYTTRKASKTRITAGTAGECRNPSVRQAKLGISCIVICQRVC
jgi:hypothetical protein